ncbi:rhodanese-like domain-containing protein [Arenibacter aquaticus]|uniref:Rhodanese-like domain-containing protein n=1 Tax=Arenibacter aquaticus TaxID=2489054 RepID=A0A430K1F6_9FLAO|nr:rhodanese-like domain-containing protein [Arenibacter aquaticus]RTE52914.1 rhodanese-like domain-containing protein [Arenibacter aquaticus]
MRTWYILLVSLVLQTGCSEEKVADMPITEFEQEMLANGILVDVRTAEEFEAGHLENAMNIDWYNPEFADQFKDFGKDETIYVYCKMGGRSAKAKEKLKLMGFAKVVNLEGGYEAFKQKKEK